MKTRDWKYAVILTLMILGLVTLAIIFIRCERQDKEFSGVWECTVKTSYERPGLNPSKAEILSYYHFSNIQDSLSPVSYYRDSLFDPNIFVQLATYEDTAKLMTQTAVCKQLICW